MSRPRRRGLPPCREAAGLASEGSSMADSDISRLGAHLGLRLISDSDFSRTPTSSRTRLHLESDVISDSSHSEVISDSERRRRCHRSRSRRRSRRPRGQSERGGGHADLVRLCRPSNLPVGVGYRLFDPRGVRIGTGGFYAKGLNVAYLYHDGVPARRPSGIGACAPPAGSRRCCRSRAPGCGAGRAWRPSRGPTGARCRGPARRRGGPPATARRRPGPPRGRSRGSAPRPRRRWRGVRAPGWPGRGARRCATGS